MKKISSIAKLPPSPTIYAVYVSQGRGPCISHVGATRSLQRIARYLLERGQSVPVRPLQGLDPGTVARVQWWEHGDFATQHVLVAAKAVAQEVLCPAVAGSKRLTEPAKQVYASDHFHRKMRELFSSEPSGQLTLPDDG